MELFWSPVILIVIAAFVGGIFGYKAFRKRGRKRSSSFISSLATCLILMGFVGFWIFSLQSVIPTGRPKTQHQFKKDWASILYEKKIDGEEYIFWAVRKEGGMTTFARTPKKILHPAEYEKKKECKIPDHECLVESTEHGIVIKETQTRTQKVEQGGK